MSEMGGGKGCIGSTDHSIGLGGSRFELIAGILDVADGFFHDLEILLECGDIASSHKTAGDGKGDEGKEHENAREHIGLWLVRLRWVQLLEI